MIHYPHVNGFLSLAHLGEVNAERVGVVLPADVDLGLRAATFPLDLGVAGQSEGRLLGDQLHEDTRTRTE